MEKLKCSSCGKQRSSIRRMDSKCKPCIMRDHRELYKVKAIEYKGGKCTVCGYNKCSRALQFHHKNPEEKDFAISVSGNTRSWNKIKRELDKCILLCSNCHAEVHAGIITIPSTVV